MRACVTKGVVVRLAWTFAYVGSNATRPTTMTYNVTYTGSEICTDDYAKFDNPPSAHDDGVSTTSVQEQRR